MHAGKQSHNLLHLSDAKYNYETNIGGGKKQEHLLKHHIIVLQHGKFDLSKSETKFHNMLHY
jgi:hypothetical protein